VSWARREATLETLLTDENAARGSLGGVVGSELAERGTAGPGLALPPRAQQLRCRVL